MKTSPRFVMRCGTPDCEWGCPMPDLDELALDSCYSAFPEALHGDKAGNDAVFTRGKGKAVSDFRGTWEKITLAAGRPGLLFHDLRRSAVRNMVRGGILETVCMRISGHKTRNVFDRYNVTSERDLEDAARKIEISQRQAKVIETQQETQQTETATIQ